MPKTLMQSVVSQLQKERTRLEDELHRVAAALAAFGNVYMHGSRPKAAVATRKRRTISAAGRKRIAAAQRARWAQIKERVAMKNDTTASLFTHLRTI